MKKNNGKSRRNVRSCMWLLYISPFACFIAVQICMVSELFSQSDSIGVVQDGSQSDIIRMQSVSIDHNSSIGSTGYRYCPNQVELHAFMNRLALEADESAPGERGRGVTTNQSSLATDLRLRLEEGYRLHGFNQLASDTISFRRRTPDFRSRDCLDTPYPDSLPSTSIIICFHNEALSTLLRTVYSVLDNSPPHLLNEVILVDDFSQHDCLGRSLEEHINQLPKVRLVRASSRLGLIRARLLGVASSTAPIVTFLDSHVECLPGWLSPLLSRVHQYSRHVVYPLLHIIDYTDFSIRQVPVKKRGLFRWMDLSYFPSPIPRHVLKARTSEADPIPSPTMPGGIFSMARDQFDHLGQYDPGLRTWGAENMELSFKVWMCNGTVELVPCSGVAHVFRQTNPNLSPLDAYTTVSRNALRVASVWMDDYSSFLNYNFMHEGRLPDIGNTSTRASLRSRLQCRDFSWYMNNVATDLYAPVHALPLKQISTGVKGTESTCLGHGFHSPEVVTADCSTMFQQQRIWYWEPGGQLLGQVLYGDSAWACLTAGERGLSMHDCNNTAQTQLWQHTHSGSLQSLDMGGCIILTERGASLGSCDTVQWDLLTFD